jgi:hypothetical protein
LLSAFLFVSFPFFSSLLIFFSASTFFTSNQHSVVGIDWLRAGRLSGRCLSPGRFKNFLHSTSSRPALWSTQVSYPVGTGGCFHRGKAAGV